jgi:hypothetical protein
VKSEWWVDFVGGYTVEGCRLWLWYGVCRDMGVGEWMALWRLWGGWYMLHRVVRVCVMRGLRACWYCV